MNKIESIISSKPIAVVRGTNRPASFEPASFKNFILTGCKEILYPGIRDQKNALTCSSKGG